MNWGQEEKGTTEDEMAGWHHQLDGHESEWTPGVGDGQGGLVCCDSCSWVAKSQTRLSDWTELKYELNEWANKWMPENRHFKQCYCYCWVASVMSDSVRPQRWQPTRLPRPWESSDKNTRVGCHFLLQCVKVKSEREVAQISKLLCNPMDCSLPGSSIHGIFQARILEWGAFK